MFSRGRRNMRSIIRGSPLKSIGIKRMVGRNRRGVMCSMASCWVAFRRAEYHQQHLQPPHPREYHCKSSIWIHLLRQLKSLFKVIGKDHLQAQLSLTHQGNSKAQVLQPYKTNNIWDRTHSIIAIVDQPILKTTTRRFSSKSPMITLISNTDTLRITQRRHILLLIEIRWRGFWINCK